MRCELAKLEREAAHEGGGDIAADSRAQQRLDHIQSSTDALNADKARLQSIHLRFRRQRTLPPQRSLPGLPLPLKRVMPTGFGGGKSA